MIQEGTEQSYDFVDEFLEEALISSSLFATYDHWSSDHNIHASIRISNTLHNKCMNLLFLPEIYPILDSGADTCVLGKGWEILSIHSSRRENVFGFDHEAALKRNFPIMSAITAVDLPDGTSILLVIHEGIYNETANHSLLSQTYLREFGVKFDSKCHRHGGLNRC